ncbi:hypothetical protein JGU66_13000 [Myxococcaceae bacterium JPH2]|nr:hypothetical protein [Myxococcaceae bacterium JPH2]
MSTLPMVDAAKSADTLIQRLSDKTALSENTAVHVRLPAPSNDKLKDSLIRIVGSESSPVVMFRSDALAQMGLIKSSPGPEFFTSLSNFDDKEIDTRLENEAGLLSGKFGETTPETVLFEGRSPVSMAKGLSFDLASLNAGIAVPAMLCPVTPASTTAAWGKSLLITAPQVVQDPTRTWDPCTGAGTQGGVWTFAHLMRQLATNSGNTPDIFVQRWLETWLNPQVINNDSVAQRLNMFNQVIQPWATASGGTATLVVDGSGRLGVSLTAPLNLNIAPFRLLAIVNRVDLGRTVNGPAGYGGGTTSQPVNAGELRFIFGVTQKVSATNCGLKQFTTIFEYGVPITGCSNVVAWARDWLNLNSFATFNSGYLTALQGITQRVVMANLAPTKGNKNALNQIRTNEISLATDGKWELREFTLSAENFVTGTDTPVSGLLRPHTVAQSPDDGLHPAASSPLVDQYVRNVVLPTVPAGSGPAPAQCSSNYTVPYSFLSTRFRGGNSLIPPNFWKATSINPALPKELCARHDFSLNTCQGCHRSDTATVFTHVKPTTGIPAALSSFLTGGGPGSFISVSDTQFPASGAKWRFADLDRRWRRLNQLATCTFCSRFPVFSGGLVDAVGQLAGVVPIDPVGPLSSDPKFEVGPITDFAVVKKVLDTRAQFFVGETEEPLNVVRPAESFTH